MVQISRFWSGTSQGDATEAPYDAASEFAAVLRSIATAQQIPTNLSGVFRGEELGELAVSGAATPASIATGRALVYGNWYENDAIVTEAIATPAAGLSRIDVIVLRKDWAAQTVRIARIVGTPGTPGVAPTLTATQVPGTTWDMPLANVGIDDAGVITITDRREFLPRHGDHSAESTGTHHDITQIGNAIAAVPSGTVVFFNGAACPTGYTEVTDARGRVLVGKPAGGTIGGMVGTALADLADREITDIPAHVHAAGTLASDSNGAHTHTIPGTDDITGVGSAEMRPNDAGVATVTTSSNGAHTHVVSGSTASTGIAAVDVTMPYIQFLVCEKD